MGAPPTHTHKNKANNKTPPPVKKKTDITQTRTEYKACVNRKLKLLKQLKTTKPLSNKKNNHNNCFGKIFFNSLWLLKKFGNPLFASLGS